MSFLKKCFMPNCRNSNENENENKKFFPLPRDFKIRKLWWQSAGLSLNSLSFTSAYLYCCEEHFKIPEDFENWGYAKFAGVKPKLKKGVLPRPHVEISPNISTSLKRPSNSDEKIVKVVKFSIPHKNVPEKENIPKNEKAEVFQLSGVCSTSTLSESSIVARSPSRSITTTPSSTSISSSEEYVPSESSSAEEISDMNTIRVQSTITAIENNSRFYLGLPQDVYDLVKMLCNKCNIIHRDLLITLKKIRLDDTYFRLHIDFQLSVSQVHKVFTKTVPILSNMMNNFIFWPEANKIQDLLPLTFRARYAKVQSIIDCFEVQIEKPSNPILQANTWSDYKQCNTVKFLISCTPNGFINFISQAYPGRISDKNIVEKSNYLNRLPNGAHVLADRGFKHIEKMLLDKNCMLIRPASVSSNEQSSAKNVRESRQIASIRIHIERIIRRIREFAMLHPHACTNHKLINLMSHFAVIACGIINFQEPIL